MPSPAQLSLAQSVSVRAVVTSCRSRTQPGQSCVVVGINAGEDGRAVDGPHPRTVLSLSLPESVQAAAGFFGGAPSDLLSPPGKDSFEVDSVAHCGDLPLTVGALLPPLLSTSAHDAGRAWVQGFDTTIIACGQRGTGKSSVLFGSPLHGPSIAHVLLTSAFARLGGVARAAVAAGSSRAAQGGARGSGTSHAAAAGRARLVLSLWSVSCDEVEVDLLAGPVPLPPPPPVSRVKRRGGKGGASAPFQPRRVAVGDMEEAREVLREALLASGNVQRGGAVPHHVDELHPLHPRPGRAHVFLRLELEQPYGPGSLLEQRSGSAQDGGMDDGQPPLCTSTLTLVDSVGVATVAGSTTLTGRVGMQAHEGGGPDPFTLQHVAFARLVDALVEAQGAVGRSGPEDDTPGLLRQQTAVALGRGGGDAAFRHDAHTNCGGATAGGLLVRAKGDGVAVTLLPGKVEAVSPAPHYGGTAFVRHLSTALSPSRLVTLLPFISESPGDVLDTAVTLRTACKLRRAVSHVARADVLPKPLQAGVGVVEFDAWRALHGTTAQPEVATVVSIPAASLPAAPAGRPSDGKGSVPSSAPSSSSGRSSGAGSTASSKASTAGGGTPRDTSAPAAPFFGEGYHTDLRTMEGEMGRIVQRITGSGRCSPTGGAHTSAPVLALPSSSSSSSRPSAVNLFSPAGTLPMVLSPGTPLTSPIGVALVATRAKEPAPRPPPRGGGAGAPPLSTRVFSASDGYSGSTPRSSSLSSSSGSGAAQGGVTARRRDTSRRPSALEVVAMHGSARAASVIVDSSSSSSASGADEDRRAVRGGTRPSVSRQASKSGKSPQRSVTGRPPHPGVRSRANSVASKHAHGGASGSDKGSANDDEGFGAIVSAFGPSIGLNTIQAFQDESDSSSEDEEARVASEEEEEAPPAAVPHRKGSPPVSVRVSPSRPPPPAPRPPVVADPLFPPALLSSFSDDPVLHELARAVVELAEARRAGVSNASTHAAAAQAIDVARQLAQEASTPAPRRAVPPPGPSLDDTSSSSLDAEAAPPPKPSAADMPPPFTMDGHGSGVSAATSLRQEYPLEELQPLPRAPLSPPVVGMARTSPSRGSSPAPLMVGSARPRDGFVGLTTPQEGVVSAGGARHTGMAGTTGSAVSARTRSTMVVMPLPASAPSSPVKQLVRRRMVDGATQTTEENAGGQAVPLYELQQARSMLPAAAAAFLEPYSFSANAKTAEATAARQSSAELEEKVAGMAERLASLVQHLHNVVNAAEAAAAAVDAVEADEVDVLDLEHRPSNPSRGSRAMGMGPGEEHTHSTPRAAGLYAAARAASAASVHEGSAPSLSPFPSPSLPTPEREQVDSLRHTAVKAREYAATLRQALGLAPVAPSTMPSRNEVEVRGGADGVASAPQLGVSPGRRALSPPRQEHRAGLQGSPAWSGERSGSTEARTSAPHSPSRSLSHHVGGGPPPSSRLPSTTLHGLAEEASALLHGALAALQSQLRQHRQESYVLREELLKLESSHRLEAVSKRRIAALSAQLAEHDRLRLAAEIRARSLERNVLDREAARQAADAQVHRLLQTQSATLARLEQTRTRDTSMLRAKDGGGRPVRQPTLHR